MAKGNRQAPVGIGNYRELTTNDNYLFVDRTEQIPLLIGSAKVTAIHTFRRSGKSLFASMAAHFFAKTLNGLPTKGLFDHLAIGKNQPDFVQAHQGQYPVVFMSLKGVKGLCFDNACDSLLQILKQAYNAHDYLRQSNRLSETDKEKFNFFCSMGTKASLAQLQNGLFDLTALLYKHHDNKQVMVILDEYDAPLITAHHHGYLDNLMPVYREFLGNALKDNDHLNTGILLGVLRISKESILSGLNNPEVYTLLNPGPYQPYFGFTEDEVISLFNQAGLSHKIAQIRKWYNGYRINGQALYNPWSIMKCINQKGALRPHWVNTSNDDLLKSALLNAPIEAKQQFQSLMTSNTTIDVPLTELVRFEEIDRDPMALWGLLYQTGYLTAAQPLKAIRTFYQGVLCIPNEEIKGLYIDFFAAWLREKFGPQKNPLLKALAVGDMSTFCELLEDFLVSYASSRNLHYEASYHNLILGLIAGLVDTHHVFSDTLETGRGYTDLLIIPKAGTGSDLGIIIELKRVGRRDQPEAVAQQGLAQIEQLNYASRLKAYDQITRVLKVGMAFMNKSVIWQSEQEVING